MRGSNRNVSYGDLAWIDGLFVGQLDNYERDLLDRAVNEGKAEWVYEGVAGFLGLGKVRVIAATVGPPDAIRGNGQREAAQPRNEPSPPHPEGEEKP